MTNEQLEIIRNIDRGLLHKRMVGLRLPTPPTPRPTHYSMAIYVGDGGNVQERLEQHLPIFLHHLLAHKDKS